MMNRRTRERLICMLCARGCVCVVLGCYAGGAGQADVSTSNCADEHFGD